MKDLVDLLYNDMVNALHFEGDAVVLRNFILQWKKAIEEVRESQRGVRIICTNELSQGK